VRASTSFRRFAALAVLLVSWSARPDAAPANAAPAPADPAATRAAGGAPAARLRLDRYFRQLHARGAFWGAVVVSDQGRPVYEGAFGFADRERRVPFTTTSPVDGASLAKTFTAAAVLTLVAEGRLSLEDPAARHVPELAYDVTVRQLITHTSGLPDYDWFEPFFAADEVRTAARRLQILRERKPALTMTPGQSFEYNGFGFDLAALIVERLGGRSFDAFLRERFFAPLGMTDSFVRPARLSAFEGVRTRGYRRERGRMVLFDALDLEGFYGGGNVYASARDLARWNEAWIDRPPLPAALLEAGLTPTRLGEGPSGLTLLNLYRSPDATRFWYHGHWQGFHHTIWRDVPRRRSIVFVSNNAIGDDLQSGLVPDVVALLDGRERPAPPTWKPLTQAELATVSGRWSVAGVGEVELDRGEDRFHVRDVTGVSYALFPTGPGVFYAPGLEVWLGFDRDGAGRPGFGRAPALVWRTLVGGFRGTKVAPRSQGAPPR
jgi:CubicO group peptidase (beta-lactamase class C family)